MLFDLQFGVWGDQAAVQREQDQVGVAFEVERHHDVMLVELHSLLT